MKIKLTRTSQDSLNKILKKRMNAAEAADYLRNKPTVFRSFGETLSGMFAGDDLVGTLRAYYLELDPTLNPRTVTRKLQNWTKDRNLPSRDDIFRIAFALGLTEEELDYLLAIATGYCIQYRDGRELVLAWFLRNGLPYEEALAFFETLPAYKPANALPSTTHTQLTHQIETSSFTIYTTDDLRAYYCANLHRFGTQHLRAYFYFDRYLEQLVQPTPLPGEKTSAPFSIDTVMEEYLALNMPPGRRRTKLTVVQKLIKQNWPNTTALTNMKNHVIDVPVLPHDLFCENDTVYSVTPWEANTSIGKIIMCSDTTIGAEVLWRVIGPIVDGLAMLHDAGLIHGNICPPNLVVHNNVVRLVLESAPINYLAVEQCGRDAAAASGPWTDVYGLCATIYACITGIHPMQALSRIAARKLAPPRASAPPRHRARSSSSTPSRAAPACRLVRNAALAA